MVAVIAFVALQFGWISKPGAKKDDSRKESPQDEKSPGSDVFTNLMGGLMKQMGPVLEQSMARAAAGEGNLTGPPQAKPTIDFE